MTQIHQGLRTFDYTLNSTQVCIYQYKLFRGIIFMYTVYIFYSAGLLIECFNCIFLCCMALSIMTLLLLQQCLFSYDLAK